MSSCGVVQPAASSLSLKARPGSRTSLVGVLLLFMILGALYNASLPLFEAPDEMDHFRYANWLAMGHGLPNIYADLGAVGHEIGQPPLYYLLLAPVVGLFDTDDLQEIAPPNPYWRQGAGINVHYHTPAERFPYRGTALAVHVARFVSTVLASLAIVSAYGMARLVVPQYAVWAAALVAFNPQFVFISAAINNDGLVAALCGLACLFLVRQLVQLDTCWRQSALVGVLWGLATLAKLSGLALGGVLGIGLLLKAWRYRSWEPLYRGVPAASAGFAVTAGWWLVRNRLLYGDLLAWQAMLSANETMMRPRLLDWLNTLRYAAAVPRSFWGVFGYGVYAPSPYYWFVGILCVLALAGIALWVPRAMRRSARGARPWVVILLTGWSLIVAVSLLRWMRMVEYTNQGRLLFPAISSLAVLTTLGLSMLNRRSNWLMCATVSVLAVWAAVIPILVIQPAYARPRPLSAAAEIPNPVAVHFGTQIELLGYRLSSPSVRPGEPLEVEIYWQALVPISESYVVALHALDSHGRVVAALDTIPYGARYPTAVWSPELPFRDAYSLPCLPSDAEPGKATLLLTVYPWGRPRDALPVFVGGVQVGHGLNLAPFKVAQVSSFSYTPPRKSDAVFGAQARLLGFDLPMEASIGRAFPVALFWQAVVPDGHDYTVFVHVLDEEGKLVAQADSPPQGNRYPTSIWEAGEQLQDVHVISLPNDLKAGRYRLAVGLYDFQTGQRLPAWKADGSRWANDSADLGTVSLVEER